MCALSVEFCLRDDDLYSESISGAISGGKVGYLFENGIF